MRVPVFLSRRPDEALDTELRDFYTNLLATATSPALRDGRWRLCEQSGWPDNTSHRNMVAWCWQHGKERYLIVVNLSAGPAQARIRVEWNAAAGHMWSLNDKTSGRIYDRSGDDLVSSGLYVELGPWSSHLFECRKGKSS